MGRIVAIGFLCLLLLGCKKNNVNRWNITPDHKVEVVIHDISKNFFNVEIPLSTLKADNPFFFDNSSDSIWEAQRRDPKELSIYHKSLEAFGGLPEFGREINPLFSRYLHYFPQTKAPTVFVYSSGLQGVYEPVIYSEEAQKMFVAMDGFLGEKSPLYDSIKVYSYLRTSMDRGHVRAQIVRAIGENIVPFDPKKQTFLDLMLYEGKKLILADALIPDEADEFKIGYTPQEIEWSIQNEGNIWNFFVEQNFVFKNDKTLYDRFLQVSPFSKFNNEIEQESPGRIGAWIGWQILRKYLRENPSITLPELINDMDSEKIFRQSKYKPSKTEVQSYRTEKKEGVDELYHYAE